MSFDPDAYLAAKAGPAFDPDAYLKQKELAGSPAGAVVDHASNAALFGFGDELAGAWRAFVKSHVPASLGGVPGSFSEQYPRERDAIRQRFAAESAEHPIASGVGDVAGALAPGLLIPAGAVSTIGRAAITGGVQGGLAGLGNSDADLTKGDIGGALKATGAGVGAGIVAGAAGKKIADAIPNMAGAAQDFLKDVSERKAVNSLRPTAQEVRALIQQGKLGELGDWLLRNKVVEAGDTFADVATKAQGVKAGAGNALNNIIGDLDRTGETVDKVDLARKLVGLVQDAEQQGPAAKPLVAKYTQALRDVMEGDDPSLSFSQAETWKRAFQDRVNYGKINPTAAQQGDKELASAARQAVEDAAERAANKTGTGSDFVAAKQAYGNAAQASGMAEGALARQEARNIASPSDKFTAGGTFLAGVLTGHPVAGAAAGLAVGGANKLIRDRAASTTAVIAKSASEKLAYLALHAPQELGRFGPILAGALQRGGQQEFAARSYALTQTDPDFQSLQQKLAEAK